MRFHAPPGAPLQAGVDRLHGHGLFLPTLTGDATTASSVPLGATAVTGGSAHTKGAWAEVTASTASSITMLVVNLSASNSGNNTDTSTLLDIGTGGAGSEVVVVPDMQVGWSSGGFNSIQSYWFVPVSIPKGSRVAIRAQSARTTQNIATLLTPVNATVTRLPAPTKLVNIGANTATSGGVTLTAPGSNNTKSAWTELTATCPQALQAVVMCPGGGAGVTVMGNLSLLVDLGVGAAGSEVVTVSNWPLKLNGSGEIVTQQAPMVHPVNIPAGARIAARYQSTSTATNTLDMILLGVPA